MFSLLHPSVEKKSRQLAFDGLTIVLAIGSQLRRSSHARFSADIVLRWLSAPLAIVAPMPLIPRSVRIDPERSTNVPV